MINCRLFVCTNEAKTEGGAFRDAVRLTAVTCSITGLLTENQELNLLFSVGVDWSGKRRKSHRSDRNTVRIHEFRSADQKNEERAETDAGTDGERGTDMNKIDSNNETDFLTGNNMTEKLIRDGKESRRAKWNLLSVSVGAVLLLMGVICVLMKALTGTDIDENGLLQENFFLLPAALLFFFGGFITFLATGIHNVIEWGISKGSTDRPCGHRRNCNVGEKKKQSGRNVKNA